MTAAYTLSTFKSTCFLLKPCLLVNLSHTHASNTFCWPTLIPLCHLYDVSNPSAFFFNVLLIWGGLVLRGNLSLDRRFAAVCTLQTTEESETWGPSALLPLV